MDEKVTGLGKAVLKMQKESLGRRVKELQNENDRLKKQVKKEQLRNSRKRRFNGFVALTLREIALLVSAGPMPKKHEESKRKLFAKLCGWASEYEPPLDEVVMWRRLHQWDSKSIEKELQVSSVKRVRKHYYPPLQQASPVKFFGIERVDRGGVWRGNTFVNISKRSVTASAPRAKSAARRSIISKSYWDAKKKTKNKDSRA